MDVWHAYEFGFLTENGKPVAGILKLVYTATNEFLVESKSLKLYLKSFNMDRYGKTRDEGISLVIGIIQTDLSDLLKCEVEVNYFDHTSKPAETDYAEFTILEKTIDFDKLNCTHFTEHPELLELSTEKGKIKWGTHLLRSNCKITHQPDWGSLFIEMKGEKLPTPGGFLKYIVSLRNENHFHEEICEMVFKRLVDHFSTETLMVTCLYTRRGGIDINPTRSLTGNDFPATFINSKKKDLPVFRQ